MISGYKSGYSHVKFIQYGEMNMALYNPKTERIKSAGRNYEIDLSQKTLTISG